MIKNLKNKLKKNIEITVLAFLIIFTVISTSYYNFKKNLHNEIYNGFIDNIYFKKTLNQIIQNLEPKYEKIKHKVETGETFDNILENYQINKDEIIKIKQSLKNKTNLDKLKTSQIIQFRIDKTNNQIVDFTYQLSNTQKTFPHI